MARRLDCVFHVAAGPRVGFGHLMRARTLARVLDVPMRLSLRGGTRARTVARAHGWTLVDAAQAADVVVVDDPSPRQADARARQAARRGMRVVRIRDGARSSGPADLVVDLRVAAASVSNASHLSGPRYCVIDPAVRQVRRTGGTGRPRVLVALGGGAHVRRLAVSLVAAIAATCPDADVRVAAGLTAGPLPPLPGGRWVVQREGLVAAMARVDVVVAGGGITLQEACALGVPTIGLAVVRAQRPAIAAMARRGAVIDGGGPSPSRVSAGRVARAVARVLGTPAERRTLATRARRTIDGRGASRVARAIVRLAGKSEGRRG